MSRRLVDLLEKERHEIGSSLHDQIGQILTGVSMHLEELKQHGTDDASALTDRVGQIQALVRKAMKQAKRISHGLRSEVLERFGLVASIRHLINELEEQCDLKVYLFVKDIPKGFQGGKKGLAIFRLVQEGLNNIVKHAGATEVFINLAKRDGTVFLSIEDDGVGFDYNKLHEGDDVGIGPLGITIMRERISQIGGDFHVDSRPGRGTCITAEIPVTKREIEQDKK